MNSYIFITTEGYTFQPGSSEYEPDIENCQVMGFGEGRNPKEAFESILQENKSLLDTTFDELICMELKDRKSKHYFHLDNYRKDNGT